MKIVVVLRQVPDLVEPLEVADTGTELDLDEASFVANETDDHALEQALLIKGSVGGTVTIVTLDCNDVDNTLYAAAAKGADQIVKIALADDRPPPAVATAAMLANVIRDLHPDLTLLGCQAHDTLEGALGARIAHRLELPYVGVVRGVQTADQAQAVHVFKEFPGAALARMRVDLPAVLGILAADQPPRYVPVSRIRAAMKTTQFDQRETERPATEPLLTVTHLRAPESGQRATILEGEPDAIAGRIADILREKGLVK